MGKKADARIAELRSWIRVFEGQHKQTLKLAEDLGATIDAMQEEVETLLFSKGSRRAK